MKLDLKNCLEISTFTTGKSDRFYEEKLSPNVHACLEKFFSRQSYANIFVKVENLTDLAFLYNNALVVYLFYLVVSSLVSLNGSISFYLAISLLVL